MKNVILKIILMFVNSNFNKTNISNRSNKTKRSKIIIAQEENKVAEGI